MTVGELQARLAELVAGDPHRLMVNSEVRVAGRTGYHEIAAVDVEHGEHPLDPSWLVIYTTEAGHVNG